MSLLYVGCMKFPTNQFVRNFCPFQNGSLTIGTVGLSHRYICQAVMIFLRPPPNKDEPTIGPTVYAFRYELLVLHHLPSAKRVKRGKVVQDSDDEA